ncbi:Cullin-associated NEDD8-dissociated protein 1, partial [Fragariocoptes setiger]
MAAFHHVPTLSVQGLLEKMTSSDKDFRFMAANDLMGELQAENISLDEESEQKVVNMLMRLLEDKNGEVQNLAVRCLGPLTNKVKDSQVEVIISTLCTNLMSDNEQTRDISSMGLKTVISEIPITSSMVNIISRELNPKLLEAITNAKDVSVQLESLDILTDLLLRIGSQLESYHANIQQSLIQQLTSDRLAVRKRAMLALSQLMISCSVQLYNSTMAHILNQLKSIAPASAQEISQFANGPNYSSSRTLLQCTGSVIRAAGHRSTGLLDDFIPIVQQFCAVPDDELREFCLQVFEAFVRRCPHEIVRYLPQIVKICLETIAHDPNYNYEDNDSDVEDMEMDGPDEDGESADEYSDDDDMSWKVRRASAKCIEAIISARQDMVGEFYVTLAPTLVSRFKEREESVKVDILHAFIALLRQTRPLANATLDTHGSSKMTNLPLPIVKLREMIPTIVSKATSQLREKAIKTRQGMFNVIIEIMHVMPGALADHIAPLMPGILYSLADKNSTSNMKIDALSFVDGLLRKHPPQVFHPHIQVILPAVANAVSDPFYKISSEALVVLTQLVRVIRPLDQPNQAPMSNFQVCIPIIYSKALEKISANDIDQEVKERAISCMGQVIATFGDHMGDELANALPLLMSRLNNEITRLTCVKALITITNSPLNISLDRLFPEAFLILASFLRKNQRSLKLSTLVLLDSTIKRAGHLLDAKSVEHILVETPPLINESDLHVSQLTLNILTSIIRTHKAFLPIVPQTILPEALQLIRSPLLQGAALKSMLQFFSAIVQNSFPGLDHNALYTRLIEPIYKGMALHKQAYQSTAKAVAAISVNDTNRAFQTVRQIITDIRVYKDKETIHSLGLLIIGEIGKSIDLGSVENLCQTILDAFGSPHEDVKSAASYSLGSVAVGNLHQFLPLIMTEIEARNRRQYLLLHSLREVITCGFVDRQVVDLHLEPIWDLLLKHCECPEEGTRSVVAECLGKLTLLRPGILLQRLRGYLHNEFAQSPLARSTVVTAIKFTISDQPLEIDDQLRSNLEDFLITLQDKDINVRRVALVTFNSAAHNKPSLIRDLLPKILPRLYEETIVKTDLIREVEMGPFKHTVDDGLDLRKAAFECMYTLLDTCQAQLDIFDFLSHVEGGLKDHYDIKMLTYLMLVRLATLCPSAVLQRLDRLVEPIRSVCDMKPKTNAVKQEYEKQDELKRSALRAFDSLKSIPDAEKNPVVSNFIQKIGKDPELLTLYKSIQRDQATLYESNQMDVN